MKGDKNIISQITLLGSILALGIAVFAFVTALNARELQLSYQAQSAEPSSFFQDIDTPQVEFPPAPRGTVATRRTVFSDTVEFAFFNRNGRILDVIEVDRPPSPEWDLFYEVIRQRFEEMDEVTQTPAIRSDGTTVQKLDTDGNDVVFSWTTWHGRERYIQRFSAPGFVPPTNV